MTSIFDQYNSTTKSNGTSSNLSSHNPPSSGYVTFRSKEEAPIFTKQKMKLNLPEDITHLTVSNNWLVCLMSHQVLLRLFLPRPDRQDDRTEVFLDKYMGGFNVSNLFFDPTGNHLLISLSPRAIGLPAELLYLHTKSSIPKRIDKFKDHEITAVAFNYINGCEATTGPILLGTKKGLIFETEFGIDGEKMFHNNWKQLPAYIPLYGMREIEGLVFDIGRERQNPVTGIEFFRVPETSRYIVLATTAERLYTFQELLKPDDRPSLQNIFTSYLSNPESCEETKNSLKYSKLRLNCTSGQKYPSHFAWLTETMILHGEIARNVDGRDFLLNKQELFIPLENNSTYDKSFVTKSNKQELIIPLEDKSSYDPRKNQENASTSKGPKIPKTLILTEFHALLLYTDHITAVCLLNQEVIYEEYFADQYGRLLDIVKDFVSGSIYVYTPKAIFRYKVTNEQRNVWKIYLEKDEFTLAEKYSRDNPAHLDIVLCKKAEVCFNQKDYIQSATIYSDTQTSFERVCLKFLKLIDKKPLMIFLYNRLNRLGEDDKTQITMLAVWMVELYLSEMARYANNSEKVRELQRELERFMSLPRVDKCIKANRSVIYDLMASHGDNHNLTALTTVNKDYEAVINQYINQGNFQGALSILRNQNKADLYYKYCPILMEEVPRETIAAIMAQDKRLRPDKLLPSLICHDSEEHITEVMKYLEFAIYSMAATDASIHNFLVTLYARYKQEKLEMYLEAQGRDISLIHYDVHYALRVCQEEKAQPACVFLQCLLELWHPAVELALTFDSKLAQQTASQPADKELRRKLWLRIAEHEIKGKNDVKKALELLKECELLRIEDLLPFFADFQKIDDFKEAICDALKEYNMKIQEQQRDMEESAKSAERVRNDLQTFRDRSINISAQELCAICEIYLLLKPFFIFPCGHKFHGDCLEKQIIPYLSSDQNRKLTSLKQKLETMLTQAQVDNANQQNATREQIKGEIEDILASDCLYCGVMIEAIDQPFIEDWDQVNVDWE